MKVYYGAKTRLSGRILQRELRGIPGPPINFGYQRGGTINTASAVRLASNKRLALWTMRQNDIPVPTIFDSDTPGAIAQFIRQKGPVVGRPDKHYGGSEFYLCNTSTEVVSAINHGCTHFTEYIEGGREFRCHVAFGKSIKIAEKMGGDSVIRNFKHGSSFMYPKDFNHKKTLRNLSKKAVMCLGLDFGAVDIIWKDGKWYILEVNSAPSLTSNSDILSRYVKAFKELE